MDVVQTITSVAGWPQTRSIHAAYLSTFADYNFARDTNHCSLLMDRPHNTNGLLPRVLRIVLVEDSLDAVHTTALLLRELGHTVDYATNGYVALDVIRRVRPDYVVCDVGLPGVDGFEVCRQVKADPELRGVSVIALTAYTDEKSRERAREAGFDGYYVKPLLPESLADLFGDIHAQQPPKSLPHAP